MVGLDGLEKVGGKQRNKPFFNSDIVGYLIANTSGFDNPDLNSGLLIAGRYDGNGFYLRRDNYLEKLPMYCAARYITYNRKWTERGRIMKSADGSGKYFRDVVNGKLDQFLLKCLLFTCIEMQNHCRTFRGSDKRFYRNELCLDANNGETLAIKALKKLERNDLEEEIFRQWKTLINHVRAAKEYDKKITYGIYQIFAEIDTNYKDELTGKTIYNNLLVHTDLEAIKKLGKKYYNREIVPTLFKYEYLK